MGLPAAVLFGILTVCIVVSLNQAAVVPKPAFDWTQFLKDLSSSLWSSYGEPTLPSGVKRDAADDVALPNTEEVDIDYQDSQFQIKPIISNPMTPFLSIKPFLPMKPTFMPPLVDPQFFIDKKTALLNGLFPKAGPAGAVLPSIGGPAIASNYFAGKKTAFLSTLFNQLATPAQQTATASNGTKTNDVKGVQRRLVAPWLTTPPPVVDPKVMTDKKEAFLNKLFSSLNTATDEVGDAADTASTASPPFWMQFAAKPPLAFQPTVKPTIVPPDFWLPFGALKAGIGSLNTVTAQVDGTATVAPPPFWMQFVAKPPLAFQPTIKPTIVPPDFWLPFGASKAGSIPMKPVVDPSVFIDKKTKFLNELMSSITSPPVETNPAIPFNALPPTNTEPVPSYDEKMSEFLDKLLAALTDPTSKRSVMEETFGSLLTRSVVPSTPSQTPETTDILLNAKDKVTNTIIGDLTGIKNSMLDTLTQMIKIQKASATMVPIPGSKPGKKVGPPFGTPFGGLWGPKAKLAPTPDPTIPFQLQIDVLNQVFDMLTNLQKEVTVAVNEAAMLPATASTPAKKNATNTTILDLLKKKLMEMDESKVSSTQQVTPQVNMYGVPLKYNVRNTHEFEEPSSEEVDSQDSKIRSIKMAVHQGYQSLPPGTTEMLQAGGGRMPQGKEGGGVKLQKGSVNGHYNWESSHHHHNM